MDSICKEEVKPFISGEQRRNKLKELTSELAEGLVEVLKSKSKEIKPVKTDDRPINLYQTDIHSGSGEVCIANPLEYQLDDYQRYIELLPEETKILFVGMASARKPPNGIPFYDPEALDKLLKGAPLDFSEYIIKSNPNDALGTDSGKIFWGCMKEYFGSSSDFFRHCFIVNFCPLIFMGENQTWNMSISDIDEHRILADKCQDTLRNIIALLKPKLVVAIGSYVKPRVEKVVIDFPNTELGYIYQPIYHQRQQSDPVLEENIRECHRDVEGALGKFEIWKEVTRQRA